MTRHDAPAAPRRARRPDEAGASETSIRPEDEEARAAGMGARFGAAGMPLERSKDFKNSTRRLVGRLRPQTPAIVVILVLSVVSVTLMAFGPKVLGHATNLIVAGVTSGKGIDYTDLHWTLLGAVGLYVGAAVLSYCQAYMVAGVVQRSMSHLRADVETKLHRLPLRYVDRQPRGDLLSRVTNDIDNLQQSLQQTMSQLLTSTLSMMAVLVMMFTISWTLALIALITVPVSIFSIKMVTKRSKAKFTDQWRHTGMLNAQVEEAFTGHALVKVFGRQRDVEETFRAKNDELFEAGNGAQFISGTIQPMMMFFGNLNYVAIALIGGLRVSSGQMSIGDIQAFIQYSRQFTQPLTQLASMINVMQSGIASAERVFELLDAEEESTDADRSAHGSGARTGASSSTTCSSPTTRRSR